MTDEQKLKQCAGEIAIAGYLTQLIRIATACQCGTETELDTLFRIAGAMTLRGTTCALAMGVPEAEIRQVVLGAFPEATLL